MMNIQGIMKQAQAMQKRMEEMQEKLAQEEVEGVSGGGMVKVTLNGKFEMKKAGVGRFSSEYRRKRHFGRFDYCRL